MQETNSKSEPSELVKASLLLMNLWKSGHHSPQEIERRALGAQRLKEAFSAIPFYARAAQSDPDYWNEFYASRVNW